MAAVWESFFLSFFKDPLTRQINEAVRIANTTNNMNRKNAWKKTAVPLTTFVRQ